MKYFLDILLIIAMIAAAGHVSIVAPASAMSLAASAPVPIGSRGNG